MLTVQKHVLQKGEMMEKLPYAESFRDLFAYQKAQELATCIFDISHDFPSHELDSLTQQIRRSSRSIGAQISEAWAKRRYKKHFVNKLTDALAELNETEHWIDTAARCGTADMYLQKQPESCMPTAAN